MMHAIISDIHGNLEALTAVLSRVVQYGAEVVCLGDIVAYGPDSIECLKTASQWPIVVAGDWDLALIEHDPSQWMIPHNQHIEWLRQQLVQDPTSTELATEIESFNYKHVKYGASFTHATPRDVREYIFPEEIYNPTNLDRIASEFDHLLFVGHTHVPGLFTYSSNVGWEYHEAFDGHLHDIRKHEKLICNVGSVGQPRDGDARAAFVIFDHDEIAFHRVDYDVEATIKKIEAIPEIDNSNGHRLREGR